MSFDSTKPATPNTILSDVNAINENIEQLWKIQQSTTEPSETYAGILWLYTPASGDWILRMRNPNDDGWMDLVGIDKTNGRIYPLDDAMYTSTMTGSESFTAGNISTPRRKKYLLDPNGADRNFNPSGVFPTGFEAVIINNGTMYNIIFDSVYGYGGGQVVPPGTMATFVYDGTVWL